MRITHKEICYTKEFCCEYIQYSIYKSQHFIIIFYHLSITATYASNDGKQYSSIYNITSFNTMEPPTKLLFKYTLTDEVSITILYFIKQYNKNEVFP